MQASTTKQQHQSPSCCGCLIIDATAIAEVRSFRDEFIHSDVKSPKNPSAIATHTNYFSGKTRGKSSKNTTLLTPSRPL